MLKRSKTSPPCILGLTPMMIAAKNGGARPAAFAPKLARASDTSLIWQAQGSQPKPYLVEAKVPAAGESARGASGIAGWRVRCSCPSGQDLVRSGGLCKHAAAALMQVVDEEAAKVEAALEELKRAHAAARLVQERAELEALDARFPGERARVMHAISLVGEQRLTAFMVDQSKTPAGLEALMGLFPATDFPVRSEAHCFRCGQDYNPNLVTSCKMPHPDIDVVRINKDAKGADFACSRCDHTWRALDCWAYEEGPSEASGLCYSGLHEPDEDAALQEGWGEDAEE